MTIGRSGAGRVHRYPAKIALSILLLLVVAYTASVPNFDDPFIRYAFSDAIIFLWVAGPGTRDWIATAVVALVFSLCHALIPPSKNVAAASISLYVGMLGRGALVVLGLKTIWASAEDSRQWLRLWLLPVGIISFALASLIALNLNVRIHLRSLDFYLYMFDGSLGFQPSFRLGQICFRYHAVADLARFIYCALPVVIAMVCAGYLKLESAWRPLEILASAAVLGYLLYFVFPASGPLYAAGSSFPGSPHPFATLSQMHPHAIALPGPAPRNAIPSLHVTWALLLWFNCRPFSSTSRKLVLMFVILTALATLGIGEHYLADLAVALPFAVAVQALWSPVPAATRYTVLGTASGLTVMWLLALRYGTHLFLLSPALPWGCVVASTILSLYMERHLCPYRDGK